MKDKNQTLRALEESIDQMDMEAINRSLEELSFAEPQPIQAEDPRLFSARILKLNQEEQTMKHPSKTLRITIVAAAVALMGLTVYAATGFQKFSFQSGDDFVTLRTNQDMTSQEAKALVDRDAEEAAKNPQGESSQGAITVLPDKTFDSLKQAETEMDMVLPLPAKLPEMALDSATGQILYSEGFEDRTVWLSYSDEKDRMFELTVSRQVITGDEAITSYTTGEMDEGSLGSYKSKSGIVYNTLSESDETGEMTANIATTAVGEYEYTLVFLGFSEAERQEIIDSADLSVYSNIT